MTERVFHQQGGRVFLATLAVLFLSALPAGAQGKAGDKSGPKHVFAGPAPAHPFDVILGRPTDRAVTASVLAYREMDAYITWGVSPGERPNRTATVSLKPDLPFEILLGNLRPATRHVYCLHTREKGKSDFSADREYSFHTQRKPGQEFVFTVQSDSHLDQGTNSVVYERTLANALADRPDFHIDIGDTFMTDKYEKYTDALPQYVAQRYYFGLVARAAPLFLVLGNHDGERLDRLSSSGDCMPVWSCNTRKKYFPNPRPDGFYTGNTRELDRVGPMENYFAWEWGDAQFIALDQFWTTPRVGRGRADGNWTRTLGREQYDWLARTLAGSKAKFRFVFIHHLVGGVDDSGRGGSEAARLYEWGGRGKDDSDQFRAKRPGWDMPIHDLLAKHKVSMVLHGHDHFFARQELDGIVYLMVPQPGHPGFDRLRNVHEYGYIRGEFLPPSGHIRVKVSGDRAVVDYVRAYLPRNENAQRKNGEVGHSFTIKP